MYTILFSVRKYAALNAPFVHSGQSFGITLATSVVYLCTICILLITLRRIMRPNARLLVPPKIGYWFRRIDFNRQLQRWEDLRQYCLLRLSLLYPQILRIIAPAALVLFIAGGIISIIHHSLTAVLLVSGIIAIFLFLRYPLALLLAWVVFNPLIGAPFPLFNGHHFLTDLMLSTTLLFFFLIPFKDSIKRLPALGLLLVFMVWILIGIKIAPINTGTFLTYWVTYFQYIAVGMLTLQLLTSKKRLLLLIDTMLVTSLFIVLYGFYGYFTRQNVVQDPFTTALRIVSIFGSAPSLALFLSIVLPLSIYRIFTLSGWKRVVVIAITFLLMAGIGLTYTRSAFVSVPLSIIVMMLCLPSRKMRISIFTGMACVVLLVLSLTLFGHVAIFNRFFSSDVLTLNGRTYLWQALFAHFDPANILGQGFKSSDILLERLQLRNSRGYVIATAAHNFFLETLYEQGIIGLSIIITVFLALFLGIINGLRKTMGEQQLLFAAVLAVLINVLLQSLDTNDIWIYLSIGIYFWITMALPFAVLWTQPENNPKNSLPSDVASAESSDSMFDSSISS